MGSSTYCRTKDMAEDSGVPTTIAARQSNSPHIRFASAAADKTLTKLQSQQRQDC